MLTVALRVMADCAGDPAGLALLVDDVDHADAQSCEFLRRLAEAGQDPAQCCSCSPAASPGSRSQRRRRERARAARRRH